MKKQFSFLWIAFSIVFFSCNNSADEPEVEEVDTVEMAAETYMWQAEMNDSTGRLELTKDRPAGLDSLAPGPIVEYLNLVNPNVQLEYVKTSGDTAYVRIPDAMYFTQQMGSSGPFFYFASAVYNLTEVPGIRYVSFDFEEGDHASPGVFTREKIDLAAKE